MMVVAPLRVARTTASMMALVPAANFSNSNTPAGLFQKKQPTRCVHQFWKRRWSEFFFSQIRYELSYVRLGYVRLDKKMLG